MKKSILITLLIAALLTMCLLLTGCSSDTQNNNLTISDNDNNQSSNSSTNVNNDNQNSVLKPNDNSQNAKSELSKYVGKTFKKDDKELYFTIKEIDEKGITTVYVNNKTMDVEDTMKLTSVDYVYNSATKGWTATSEVECFAYKFAYSPNNNKISIQILQSAGEEPQRNYYLTGGDYYLNDATSNVNN